MLYAVIISLVVMYGTVVQYGRVTINKEVAACSRRDSGQQRGQVKTMGVTASA